MRAAWIQFRYHVLCVSCPSANEFSAILFLLLARSSSNSPRPLEGFRRTLVLNFTQIWQRVKNFPIDPHCRNCPLSATLTLPKAGNFYNGDLWGNSSSVVETSWNFGVSLSFIGQKVQIISPKILLHKDMKYTIGSDLLYVLLGRDMVHSSENKMFNLVFIMKVQSEFIWLQCMYVSFSYFY